MNPEISSQIIENQNSKNETYTLNFTIDGDIKNREKKLCTICNGIRIFFESRDISRDNHFKMKYFQRINLKNALNSKINFCIETDSCIPYL